MGFAQMSADLQAPCGYDEWSYGWRATGGVFHCSQRRSVTKDAESDLGAIGTFVAP